MSDSAIIWMVMAVLAALVAGLYAGRWSEAQEWMGKGEQGFPRVHRRGKLYWVNRDGKPCFRCEARRRRRP